MCTFKYELKEKVLQGRSITFVASKLEITKNYLGNILNGYITCSRRLARDIVQLIGQDEKIEDYFIIKEK